jgi:ATP-binding cassette, subfamily F, member 2
MLFAQFAIEHPHILLLDLFYCHSFSDNLFINDETDEQTNHLDIDALAIKNFERNVVIVSHVFRLLIQVAEELWEVADKTVRNPTKEDISIIDCKRKCMKHSTVSLSPDLVVC